MSQEYYLRVDCGYDGKHVTIIGDRPGLEQLLSFIDSLLEYPPGGFNYHTLMLKEWGGGNNYISNDNPSEGCQLAGLLRLYRWD